MKNSKLTLRVRGQNTKFIDKSGNWCFKLAEAEELTVVLLLTQPGDYRIEVDLLGKNSQALILGLIIGKGQTNLNLATIQSHQSPDTASDLLIRSILVDQAYLNYQGLIKIAKKASKSNAYQQNDSLLLSDKAKIDTKPALEILPNQVRCTHGATVSQIDPDQLFYLQSRGISELLAKEMIIEGFLNEVIERVADRELRGRVIKKMSKYLSYLQNTN